MLVFVERGKPENLDKNPRSKAINSTQISHWAGTVGMLGYKRSHRCAIFASPCGYWVDRLKRSPSLSPNKARAENGLVVYESIIFFSSCSQSFTQTRRTKEKRGVWYGLAFLRQIPTKALWNVCLFSLFFVARLPKPSIDIRIVSLLFVKSSRTSFHRSSSTTTISKALNAAELFLCEWRAVLKTSPASFAAVCKKWYRS